MTPATIHLVFGPQGAGKTTYSRQLADRHACARFSIDDWMGELFSPDMAQAHRLPTQLHFVTAPHDARKRRVMARNANRGETFAFEVTPAMFDFMEAQFEAPTAAEVATCLVVNTDRPSLS